MGTTPTPATDAWRAQLAALADEERARFIRDELVRRDRARRAVEPFARFEHEPETFVLEVCRTGIWSRQAEILRSVDAHAITAAATGQKIGKTVVDVLCALWWVVTRPRGLVVMTSGNMDQVEKQLWRELVKIHQRSPALQELGGRLHQDPASGFELGDGRAIYGLTARDAERMAGYSGDQLLYIVDEASGFDDRIWTACRGNLIGGGHALLTGNPTKTSGFFFDYFTTKQDSAHTINVDARENPNYLERRKVIPGLATYEGVEELRAETGGDGSPIFDVRVAGRFPDASENAVIGRAALEAAKKLGRTMADDRQRPLRLGVDVARFGDDDSVIQPVRGKLALPATVVHGYDVVDVAGKALEVARTLRAGLHQRVTVAVDTGGLGAGVADVLRRYSELDVVGIDAGTNADDVEHFHRTRDALWWGIRTWLAEGGALPEDAKRDSELLAATYGFDERSRVKVESKDSIRKRIGRSPDRADALALAVSSKKAWSPRAIRLGFLEQ